MRKAIHQAKINAKGKVSEGLSYLKMLRLSDEYIIINVQDNHLTTICLTIFHTIKQCRLNLNLQSGIQLAIAFHFCFFSRLAAYCYNRYQYQKHK